jgi:hypothetical protein
MANGGRAIKDTTEMEKGIGERVRTIWGWEHKWRGMPRKGVLTGKGKILRRPGYNQATPSCKGVWGR